MLPPMSPRFRRALSSPMLLLVVFLPALLAGVPNPCAEFDIGDHPQITKGIPQPGWTTAQLDAWWTKMKVQTKSNTNTNRNATVNPAVTLNPIPDAW